MTSASTTAPEGPPEDIRLAAFNTMNRGQAREALNALGTIMLVMSFVIAIIGYPGYRFLTRGERGSRIEALTTIAGNEG